jgi:DNA polymerase-1
MLVGEAPGETEDRIGRPFVGDAGQLLINILREYGIARDDVYITNAVKCRPPNNSTPKLKNIDACRDYLIEEIREVQPKIIIGLGNIAMQTLLRMRKPFRMGNSRGGTYNLDDEGLTHIPVIPTYHPAYIKRNEDALNPTLEDFTRALKILSGKEKAPRKALYYAGVATVNDNHVVFDLETGGLDPFAEDSKIYCIGTSVENRVGYVTDWGAPKIKEILENPAILKVGHNIKFDIKWARQHGVQTKGKIFDTMVAAHMLDENRPSNGLKELLLLYSDMGRYSEPMEKARELCKNPDDVPDKLRNLYCAKDVDGTHRLYTLFSKQLKEEKLMPLFESTMRGEKVIAEAEFNGVQVDPEILDKLGLKYEEWIDTIRYQVEEVADEYLDYVFNPRSVQQLAELLHVKMGLPILKYTKKNQVSVDADVLERLAPMDKTGVVKGILNLRKLSGDYAKYLDPNNPPYHIDNRIHAWFNIIGTDTGRYSCSNPNLMAITKKSPIRKAFISRWKGGSIGQVDYDQGELRILAQESRDSKLINSFLSGTDIHKVTASEIFGINVNQVSDEQRFAAKTINFGIIYGIGKSKLASTIKSSPDDAEQYIHKYKARLPQVAEYISEREKQILENGEVTSIFGRKRRITILDMNNYKVVSSAQRKAVNAPIQGALHDLNVISMVRLNKELRKKGYKSLIIMPIHDAVVLDIYPGEEIEIVKLIKEVFENPDTSAFGFSFAIPMTVSITIGPNWKEQKSA